MARANLTFDAVREIGLALPDVVETTMYGSAALKVRGNLLACIPVNKSVEPDCAAFQIDFSLRASLIEENPDIYYVTDHYAGYPIVLVRMSRIKPRELRELLGLAWSFASSKKPARRRAADVKQKRASKRTTGRR